MSDSSLTVVGGSRRKKTYYRITEDVKSCKHQLGIDWVYAKDLWGKPLSVLVDAVEALVQRAQEECPDARIDVCPAWGGNEATGGSTQIVFPALGDPHQLVQDSKACMERVAALQNAGCRVALIGFGDKAGDSLYGLDPVYDWYVEEVNKHAKACNIMVFSLDLKLLSDQITLFDMYHVKDLPANRQALAGFVMDVASLLQIARFVEKAKQKLKDVGSMASLPSLADVLSSVSKIRHC